MIGDFLYMYYAFIVLLLGLCIGSFLNVVALRAFTGESIVLPPSKCPKCGNKLKWYHNIPVLSYLFLRGKCAFCGEKISIQYPIVEFVHGVLYFATFMQFGFSLKTLFACILISFLTVFCITDIKEQVIFNRHFIPFIVVMFISSFFNAGGILWYESILTIIFAFIFFEVVARLGYLFAPSRMFGEGDTYIAMGIGAFFGIKPLIAIFIIGVIFQAIISIPVMIKKSIKNKNYKFPLAILLATISIISAICLNIFGADFSLVKLIISLSVVFLCLVASIILIIADIKNKKEEDLTFFPFGPALAVGTVIWLFFAQYISNLTTII